MNLARLTHVQALALTAMGEARGDSRQGGSSVEERIGCMLTVRNRLHAAPARFGATLRDVCLRPKQYSCWNEGDPNRALLVRLAESLAAGNLRDVDVATYPTLRETLYLAEGVATLLILDRVNGATHYYSPRSMVPAGSVPYWAKGVKPCAEVGGSLYFKNV